MIINDQRRLLDQLVMPVDYLPIEALRRADANRSTLTAVFLSEIHSYLASDVMKQKGRSPIFFIFHLLGSWGEQSAYPLLAQLLRLPPDVVHAVFGDAISLTSHRVLISVFDGDPTPIHEIIRDPNADEFARMRAFTALTGLTLRGSIPRRDTTAFHRACFIDMKPQTTSAAWIGWQSSVAALGLSDMSGLVKSAFDRQLIDPSWASYRHYLDDLHAAETTPPLADRDEYAPFGDIVTELSGWSSFSTRGRYW